MSRGIRTEAAAPVVPLGRGLSYQLDDTHICGNTRIRTRKRRFGSFHVALLHHIPLYLSVRESSVLLTDIALGYLSALGGNCTFSSFGGSASLQYIPAIFTTNFVDKEGVEPTCNQLTFQPDISRRVYLSKYIVDKVRFELTTSTLSVLRC